MIHYIVLSCIVWSGLAFFCLIFSCLCCAVLFCFVFSCLVLSSFLSHIFLVARMTDYELDFGSVRSTDNYAIYENVPSMKSFTGCTWFRSGAPDGTVTLWSYSVSNNPEELSFLIDKTSSPEKHIIELCVKGSSTCRCCYAFLYFILSLLDKASIYQGLVVQSPISTNSGFTFNKFYYHP